jgi:hypothetical protein
MKKQFTLRMKGKAIIDMEFDGDDDIVNSFVKTWFLDSFGVAYRMKDQMGDFFIDGVKSNYILVQRDEKGHYIKPLSKKK